MAFTIVLKEATDPQVVASCICRFPREAKALREIRRLGVVTDSKANFLELGHHP